MGAEWVSLACELAVEHHLVTAPVVLNSIHRLKAPAPIRTVPVAEEWVLEHELEANCSRYDQLRRYRHDQ